jgi:threonine synthase
MGLFQAVCQSCGRTYGAGFHPVCACGGMVDMAYSLARARIRILENPVLRFFDLLPLSDEANVRWLGDGNTPTLHAQALGRLLGLSNLYLKDETRNPTLTTKDRMASMVLSFFQENGVREFACSSTGNSSTSMARGVETFPGFRLHVFVGRDFLHRMNFPSSEQVKVYWVRDATFAEAHECARAFTRVNPAVTSDRGFFNPARREGLKLAFLEAVLDMPEAPHWYFQAASSGMGVYGVWRGAQQMFRMGRLERLPRLACIQQETCCPMVRSWRAGSAVTRAQDVVTEPRGIAEAILRGNPTNTYPHLHRVVRQSGGTFESVTEAQIREAQTMLRELEGIDSCPSAATTIAAIKLMAASGELRRDEVVLANITGAERPTAVTPREFTVLTKADLLRDVA